MKVKQKIYRMCSKSKLFLNRSSSTILSCVAVIGVMGTAIASVRATLKAMKLLENAAIEKGEELSKAEVAVVVFPVYISVAVVGASTILCIFSANVLNKRRLAGLMSAYAILNNYYKEYRNELIELYGKEADIKITNNIARRQCNYHKIGLAVPDEKAIFYDEISGESIIAYEREIMDAEYHLNRNFTIRGYAFLNELYEFLGLPMTKYGETVGWSVASGIAWIDFEHRLIDNDDGGLACYSIDVMFCPEVLEEWEC